MKKILLLIPILSTLCYHGYAQTTYLTDTAMITDIGFGGAPASCVYNGGYYWGYYDGYSTGWWLADSFTVPSSATWVFDTVIIYNIQQGSTTTSPFTAAHLQIYQGVPGAGGTVIWGNATSNVLSSSGFTGIYRVDTFASTGGLTGNQRPIMFLKLYLASPPHLSAGTYWLSWSVEASGSGFIYCPPKVLPGRINPAGQHARQDSSGTWYYNTDNSHNMGFNKIIKASANLAVATLSSEQCDLLNQNIPNPFNRTTEISFHLVKDAYTTLSVYNSLGQLIDDLVDQNLSAGDHKIYFNSDGLPSGLYFYQLRSGSASNTKQMQILR